MNFHISFKTTGEFSGLMDCISALEHFQPQAINLVVDASEVISHWEKFQKLLFEADLLGINGIFIQGALEGRWKEKVDNLYAKSIFNTFEKVVFAEGEIQGKDFSKRETQANQSIDDFELTDQVRAIVIWNGEEILKPKVKVDIDFYNLSTQGEVKQVQKVINTDFNGSRFGINKLESGEIGTVAWKLDHPLEKYYYQDHPTQGLFRIKNKKNKLTGYGIIIR